MFIKGDVCELSALYMDNDEAAIYTEAVNAGWTTQFMFTGSYPIRPIDIQEVWKKEREAKSVEFGIWHQGFFVGTTGLYSYREIYRLAEFRIIIFEPKAIGKGVGSDATSLVLRYGFERLNLHRIWLGVHEDNIAAIKCYEKAGFKEEGRLRKELFTFGGYHDAVRMGILEDEWRLSTQVVAQ